MKKILYQPWGGLGDNLQFSTLPEMFSKLGYEVYISDKNAYRSVEIFDLVRHSKTTHCRHNFLF